MTGEEFTELIDGMTAAMVGKIVGRCAGQIAAYKNGSSPIPYEVARAVQELREYIDKLTYDLAKAPPTAGFRRVVDGWSYDTSNSQRIASWGNGQPRGSVFFREESLYKTRHGRYFLHGRGGAQTRWAHASDDGTLTRGEGIDPIGEEEAKIWLLEGEFIKEYEALFGRLPEA